ncbi:MAG: pyridoxal kinase [Alphaproteobacteria bacterium]|nr:pyridoxal kinase [Alphaproteobacteria bacterium]|tara:strand:- start:2868 stop:3746 length:879 start_codon:yes stop_codon:yes gene_type:complete
MHILSIQSQVTFGHVGNSAIAFPLQCLGHTVWAVPTIVAANHPGYPDFAARVMPADEVRELLDGLARRGGFAGCELLISGYMGSRGVGDVVADTVAKVHAAADDTLYCCDPVIGDRDTGVYVDSDIADWFRSDGLPLADLLTPNLFELEVLCEAEPGALHDASLGEIVAAGRGLLARMRDGARMLVTSVEHRDLATASIGVLAFDEAQTWWIETPRHNFTVAPHGVGDLATALFASGIVETGSLPQSLERCANILHAILYETARRDSAEMELVAARDAIAAPAQRFVAQSID